jgi:hypothetical protein
MLIKIGSVSVINITAVKTIHVIEKSPREHAIEIAYRDIDGKDAKFTLGGILELANAFKVRDEVVGQIKELELENISATLENAIRSNGNG